MAPEFKFNKDAFAKMSTRQKATAAVVVVIFLFVGWQVIGMFKGSSPAPVAAPVVAAKSTSAPTMAATSPQGQPPGQAQPAMPTASQPAVDNSQPQQIEQGNLKTQSAFLDAQQQTQKTYINALNQLQMLRIDREIEETNEAIASAKLKTVKAQNEANGILSSADQGPTTGAGYGNKLMTTSSTDLRGAPSIGPPGGPPGSPGTNMPPPPVQIEVPYVVVSVSMQMDKWTAIIGYKDNLYNVTVGDTLPVDGSVVEHISKNGVILIKDEKKRKISLLSSI